MTIKIGYRVKTPDEVKREQETRRRAGLPEGDLDVLVVNDEEAHRRFVETIIRMFAPEAVRRQSIADSD